MQPLKKALLQAAAWAAWISNPDAFARNRTPVAAPGFFVDTILQISDGVGMGLLHEQFVAKWQDTEGGQERANYGMFLTELCEVLDVPRPDPANATTENNDYVFERAVARTGRDGTKSQGRIDLYKRGSFVLEAKQSRQKGGKKDIAQNDPFNFDRKTKPTNTREWDVLMLNARQQAEDYARHLPTAHEWPPFIIVCDVGNCFELYADFTGKGRNYSQFPDRQGFRIQLKDLEQESTRKLLKDIWQDPLSLDPSKKSAKATREIASALAEVSKRLEKENHPPEEVALFLMRCLFTMFAEDSKLIPEQSFTQLLERCTDNPKAFVPMISELWKQMNTGGFAVAIGAEVKRFNGKLFVNARVFPMSREDIGVLKAAAAKDWTEVDPSIFGTLLEQALSPADRSSLGAHYTPRAYVERLVIATVMEPLRDEWNNVQGSLEVDADEALARVKAFHQKLCDTKVLDPACGTGNFLYVTLELMKRLEGEVLDTMERLGGQDALRLEKFTVDPHQFLGIEINPRAAAIAELVLWIGYLRWHLKTKGEAPPEPILREFKNIELRDAVLAYDSVDAKGKFVNPRRPEWPEADYIVGNPPFVAGQNFRREFGDDYAESLWSINKHISGGADFVMFWWDRAAELLTRKNTNLKRFGLVTTNSITQTFQMRVVAHHLNNRKPITLLLAIADHPWTKVTKDSAAVRIAFTVAAAGEHEGTLLEVKSEIGIDTDSPSIDFYLIKGKINPDLTVGADLTMAADLLSNKGISHDGVKLHGTGFVLTKPEAAMLGLGHRGNLERHIRPLRNGRDLAGNPRGVMVIDLFGMLVEEVRNSFPEVYQHLLQTVKPERDHNNRASYKKYWWIFGEPRKDLRPALMGLRQYIATIDTAKHRVFQRLDAELICDDGIVIVASDQFDFLGLLSSRIHCVWALRQGSLLGPTPRYNKSRCFDPFPFPDPDAATRARIAQLAEALDGHRKSVQAEHPEITLTQMYNVLEKVRANSQSSPQSLSPSSRRKSGPRLDAPESVESLGPDFRRDDGGVSDGEKGKVVELSADEKLIFDHALILILKERHEELDAAVAAAYGWPAHLSDDEILARLVALNKERAAEEARGLVRWLRPDYQIPRFGSAAEKQEQLEADLVAPVLAPAAKSNFPVGAVEQTAALMHALAQSTSALTATEIALQFKQGKKALPRVEATLSSLLRTGFVYASDGGKRFVLRRAA